jgi:hypothetical protein
LSEWSTVIWRYYSASKNIELVFESLVRNAARMLSAVFSPLRAAA